MKHSLVVKYGWGLILLAALAVFPVAASGQSGPAFGILHRFIAENPESVTSPGVIEEDEGGPAPEKTGVVRAAGSDAAAFFPLFPGTRWTYQVTGQASPDTRTVLKNTVTVQGVKARIIQDLSDKSQAFYTSDADGVRLHGQFAPHVTVPPYGTHSVRTTMIPPIVVLQDLTPGAKPRQTGMVQGVVSGLGRATLTYTADYTVTAAQTITTTAGTFEAIGVSYKLTLQGNGAADTETGDIFFARDTGEIMEAYTNSDGSMEAVLTGTNSGIHDFAVTNISAPALVALTNKAPSKTITVKVTIQNRSLYPETIPDLAALTGLITLTADSIIGCPEPIPVIAAANKKFPIVMKSKGTLTVNYNVTINCANDSSRNVSKDPAHYDYRFLAAVNTAALDGNADGHTWDDICPRSVTPPYVVDPFPDGTIKDKGCGARKGDGTFGGDIFLDVTAEK